MQPIQAPQPLKINQESKEALPQTHQPSDGKLQDSDLVVTGSNYPASERFMAESRKRMIKSTHSQSRKSKSQKRTNRIKHLHQMIIAEEAQNDYQTPGGIGTGLMNQQLNQNVH